MLGKNPCRVNLTEQTCSDMSLSEAQLGITDTLLATRRWDSETPGYTLQHGGIYVSENISYWQENQRVRIHI